MAPNKVLSECIVTDYRQSVARENFSSHSTLSINRDHHRKAADQILFRSRIILITSGTTAFGLNIKGLLVLHAMYAILLCLSLKQLYTSDLKAA